MNTLILADPYPLLMETVNQHLSKLSSIRVTATCQSERELRKILEQAPPDILMIDLEILEGDGILACKQLLKRFPDLKILLFTTITDITLLRKYFKIGVYGYLPRNSRAPQLLQAVEKLAEGQIFIPDFFRNQLAEISLGIYPTAGAGQLTSREKEVLKLIIDEHTTKEIAQMLYISNSTAETHRLHLIQKLGVRNTAGLVREGVMKHLYI